MEWRYAAVLMVLILVVSSLGCINPPSPPPISRIPKVIVDHVEDPAEFAVYVHGMSDYRYEHIEIRINNITMYEMNYTYQGSALTNLTEFSLNISVVDRPHENGEPEFYYYNATVALVSNMIFTVEDAYGVHEVSLDESTSFITTMYLAGKEPKT